MENREEVREVAWSDICPWLMIFRTFGLSINLPMLFLATVAALVIPLGWYCGELLFVGEQHRSDEVFESVLQQNARWPGAATASRFPESLGDALQRSLAYVDVASRRLFAPVRSLFQADISLGKLAYFVFGGLWTLLVWSFFGGAITRLAVVRLGRDEWLSMKEAATYAGRKLGAYFVAPLFPLIFTLLITFGLFLLGLVMYPLDLGVLLAGILWPLVLVGGFIMALLLLGLLFGWPLMWGTISTEEHGDSFDALSRSYAYTLQRPLHYLFYATLAALLGAAGWLLVFHFAEAIVLLSETAVSWGMGSERLEEVRRTIAGQQDTAGALLWLGARLMAIGNGLVRTIAVAYVYSFFWCATAAVYLLLRRDVDQTEFDDVFMEEEEERYGLPPLKPDELGVPGWRKSAEQGGTSQSGDDEPAAADDQPTSSDQSDRPSP